MPRLARGLWSAETGGCHRPGVWRGPCPGAAVAGRTRVRRTSADSQRTGGRVSHSARRVRVCASTAPRSSMPRGPTTGRVGWQFCSKVPRSSSRLKPILSSSTWGCRFIPRWLIRGARSAGLLPEERHRRRRPGDREFERCTRAMAAQNRPCEWSVHRQSGNGLGRSGRVHISRDADGTIWVGGGTVTCINGEVEL